MLDKESLEALHHLESVLRVRHISFVITLTCTANLNSNNNNNNIVETWSSKDLESIDCDTDCDTDLMCTNIIQSPNYNVNTFALDTSTVDNNNNLHKKNNITNDTGSNLDCNGIYENYTNISNLKSNLKTNQQKEYFEYTHTGLDRPYPVSLDKLQSLPKFVKSTKHSYRYLPLYNKKIVENLLVSLFSEIQQNTCKFIAKNWIKTIEPKKQTNYPYNKGDSCKPKWWPVNLRHKEPDHLLKNERNSLLAAIVLSPLIKISTLKLSLKNSSFISASKKQILNEIFYIEEMRRFNSSLVIAIRIFSSSFYSQPNHYLVSNPDFNFNLDSSQSSLNQSQSSFSPTLSDSTLSSVSPSSATLISTDITTFKSNQNYSTEYTFHPNDFHKDQQPSLYQPSNSSQQLDTSNLNSEFYKQQSQQFRQPLGEKSYNIDNIQKTNYLVESSTIKNDWISNIESLPSLAYFSPSKDLSYNNYIYNNKSTKQESLSKLPNEVGLFENQHKYKQHKENTNKDNQNDQLFHKLQTFSTHDCLYLSQHYYQKKKSN